MILKHQTQCKVSKPWSSPRCPLNLSHRPRRCEFTVLPGLPVQAKVEQRGWAAKHGTQWHMLCGFLGTAWRTVVLLCQASLYCRSPLGCGSPGHSRGWKGISLGFIWKDASLNLVNASFLHSWAVVAKLLTTAVVEAVPLSWDKSLWRPLLR